MVSVFMPGLNETPLARLPDHQSQEVLPGLIHEVSAIADGGFRLTTMLDSTSRPGSSAIIKTRQGELAGACLTTEIMEGSALGSIGQGMWGAVRSSTRGARRAVRMVWSATVWTKRPAQSSIFASVRPTQAAPG